MDLTSIKKAESSNQEVRTKRMLSSNSNAVRHRSSNHSPHKHNDNSSHHPSTSLAVKSESGDDDNNSPKGKLHGRRRDELLRSNKKLFVLAGALSVLALSLVGMWASSTSIDGGRNTRQLDQKARLSRNERATKKRPGAQLPRGIGRRKEAEIFPIPEEKISDPAIERFEENYEEEVHETRTKDRGWSPEINSRKVESEASNGSRRNEKSKDRDDDDDSAKSDEDKKELSDDEKGQGAPSSESRPKRKADRSQPRVLRLQFEQISSDNKMRRGKDTRNDGPEDNYSNLLLTKVHRLPTHGSEEKPSSDQNVSPSADDDTHRDPDSAKKSKKYGRTQREPLEDKTCKPRHEWQKGAYPNCNILHEFELGQLSGMYGRTLRKKSSKKEGDGDEIVKYLAHGYWRDVWVISKASGPFDHSSRNAEELTVIKTLRYKHDFTDRNYDRHRKDSLASERLSKSPYVVDIFAYCSNSGIYEYGSGGDIDGKLWPYDGKTRKYITADISSIEKLDMAYQVAVGISDMHDVEDDGFASIAHTDITPSQFIFINDRWKLNDFNRCRFMRVNKKDNSPCGFHVGANPGKFRAPEEYEFEEENEMIDVYSMGNIFYAILSGEMPFDSEKDSKAQKRVMNKDRPKIPRNILESEDIAIRSLVSATKKCWAHKPRDRPSAASIRDKLKETMDTITRENATRKS